MDPKDFYQWLHHTQTILFGAPEREANVDPGRVNVPKAHQDLTKMMMLAATSVIEGTYGPRSWERLQQSDIDAFSPDFRYDFREEIGVIWCIRNAMVHNDHDLSNRRACLQRVTDLVSDLNNKTIKTPGAGHVVPLYVELIGSVVNFNNKAYDRFRFLFALLVYALEGKQSDLSR